MKLIKTSLEKSQDAFIQAYNDTCAYLINQKANQILHIFNENLEDGETIDAIIDLAAGNKIAIIYFWNFKNSANQYIRNVMDYLRFTELSTDEVKQYGDCICFGQFNFGRVIDI